MTRSIGWLDLDAVVRCVLDAPVARQGAVADAILQRADTADRYRKRVGRRHPRFGDGSLADATGNLPKARVAARLDPAYLRALSRVLDRIEKRRAH